jgi:putative ABC transport system permease protein
MSRHGFHFWLAWRDLRAQPAGFRLYALALGLGIAAMTAVTSFRDSLARSVELQSRLLLGADAVVRSRRPLDAALESLLAGTPADRSREIAFRSMVYFPAQERTQFVQVRALEGGYPFYGALETSPPDAAARFQPEESALVEENVLLQTGARVGDRLKLGEREFIIAGSLRKAPGETPAEAFVAPRIYVPVRSVPATKLLGPGAVASYRVYLKFRGDADPDVQSALLRGRLSAHRADLQTAEDRRKSLMGSVDQLARYLHLVGFAALLLGCLGALWAIHVYVIRKRTTIAYLRCVGATGGDCLRIFLLQVFALAAAGVAIGLVCGVAVVRAVHTFAADFLPTVVFARLSAAAALQGALAGFVFPMAFAALPLVAVLKISPLRALARFQSDVSESSSWRLRGLVMCGLVLAVSAYAVWQTGNLLHGLSLAFGLGAVLLALTGAARALRAVARRSARLFAGVAVRQGVAGLYRPGNQTTIMMVAVGLGIFLLTTLHVCDRSLLDRLSVYRSEDQPTLVLIDIQGDQRAAVAGLVQRAGLPVQHLIPIVTMRLLRVDGRLVEDLAADPAAGVPEWALHREYRGTFRDALSDTETLVGGQWIGRWPRRSPEAPVSVEQSIAETLKVKVGDTLQFDVQGITMDLRVASLRKANWQSMKPNFYLVFPRGVLEDAPQTLALFTRVTDGRTSAALQRDLAERFPNVSAIDIALILDSVNSVLGKIAEVIRFVAAFTLMAGILVMAGALRASRFHRARENILLRTLGASRRHVATVTLVEYGAVGALGGLAGVLLAWVCSRALCRYLLKTDMVFDVWMPLALVLGVAGLAAIIGWLGARRLMARHPLEVLREVEL